MAPLKPNSDAAVTMVKRRTQTEELVLRRALRVVVVATESLKYSITTLQVGARLSIKGGAPLPGFVEVICAKVRYYVREETLRAHSTDLGTGGEDQ